jgi:hypothetical protein
MASGSGLATALAVLKGHAVAAAVVGTLVVGGGAAAVVAVTTGTVHLPGAATLHGQNGKATEAPDSATPHTAAACATSGDAARLAAIFAPMFGGASTAQTEICTLFVGSDGHAFGFGEVQQVLEITAAIEANGGKTACLSGSASHGQGSGNSGQPSFTAPTSTAGTTDGIIADVLKAMQNGTPLAQLAMDCNAPHVTGNPGSGSGGGQPTGTPGARPTGTPGARPTGTPGHP